MRINLNRYVGSPYQTSLSEAGQEKFLYCMNSRTGITNSDISPDSSIGPSSYNWSEDSRWVLNVGKKYFKVFSIFLFGILHSKIFSN